MARILAGGDATDAAPGLGARPTPRRGGFAVRCFDGQSATGQPQPTGVEADSVCQCQRDRIILRPSGGALRPGPLQGPQEGRPGAGIHRPARGQGRSEVSGQGEFSLTQVLDRPLSGRVFFEEVIRENLDLGRPDQVALIFGKRVTRRTPGWFRTRVLTERGLRIATFWTRTYNRWLRPGLLANLRDHLTRLGFRGTKSVNPRECF